MHGLFANILPNLQRTCRLASDRDHKFGLDWNNNLPRKVGDADAHKLTSAGSQPMIAGLAGDHVVSRTLGP
jgi:hypothetical protein